MTHDTARVPGWSDLTTALPATDGWMHSGVAITADGTVVCAHPEGHALVVVPPDGSEAVVVPIDLTEPHGIALSTDENVVAIADAGYRVVPVDGDHHYEEQFVDGHAALVNLSDGRIVLELTQPPHPAYQSGGWRPTSIAVDRGPDGTGDIWVADGYGANLVHRFGPDGAHRATFDGGTSGTVFDCPHGILLRRDGGELEILVADRANHRIVVLDPAGETTGVFGADELDSPSSMTVLDGDLFITELFGGVARFDARNRFVGRLEPRRRRSHEEPGWPNRLGADGRALLPPELEPGTFNSPHGIAAHDGALYLTEWHIGGRLIRIAPESSTS